MLTKRVYLDLINKFFYINIKQLLKKIKVVCFVNFTFHLDIKTLLYYQIYLYFFLSIYFGSVIKMLLLKKAYPRLNLDKNYPLGGRVHLSQERFYTFIYYFNKWYYYNIFGELKSFILDKRRGNFFGLKIPFLNLFYLFDYNLITFLLYNLNIPQFKMFVSITNATTREALALKNFFGFY
jgi:hypothetical protein